MKSDKPDMFSMAKPTRPKKEKPKPTASSGAEIAKVCGLIAGMPTSFAKALEALRDIDRRATETNALAGILAPAQAAYVSSVKREIVSIASEIEKQWRVIDAIIAEGVTKQPKEEVDLL